MKFEGIIPLPQFTFFPEAKLAIFEIRYINFIEILNFMFKEADKKDYCKAYVATARRVNLNSGAVGAYSG